MVNEVVFVKERYDKESDMWADILAQMKILTTNDYVIKFYCDEAGLGIYCLEYDRKDPQLCDRHLWWLTPEQLDRVLMWNEVPDYPADE